MFDATDTIDEARTVTSNGAAVLRGIIDAAQRGVDLALDQLGPLAEQFDSLFADADNPIPTPPAGGVPTDAPVRSDEEAVQTVGVVTS